MKSGDRDLGMDRPISRRDFLHGVGALAAGAWVPGRALAEGGFDPAREIEAITVNRWAHGYAYWYSPLFDPDFADDEYPNIVGRKRRGRIAIANSDAGARPTIDCAIDQAHRAIGDLAG